MTQTTIHPSLRPVKTNASRTLGQSSKQKLNLLYKFVSAAAGLGHFPTRIAQFPLTVTKRCSRRQCETRRFDLFVSPPTMSQDVLWKCQHFSTLLTRRLQHLRNSSTMLSVPYFGTSLQTIFGVSKQKFTIISFLESSFEIQTTEM